MEGNITASKGTQWWLKWLSESVQSWFEFATRQIWGRTVSPVIMPTRSSDTNANEDYVTTPQYKEQSQGGGITADPAAGPDEDFSQRPIRQSLYLCAGEQEYVNNRKHVVQQALCNEGIDCTADSVPHIAFLGSGGGQRAAVALVGSLYQMKKEGLLDTLLYVAGVSGSTWSMASLYSDPHWSTNMDAAVSKLSGSGVELKHALAWIGKRAKEDNFSLTDIWGVLTTAGVMKQMNERQLSHEVDRDVTNPYPIYCAVEKYSLLNGPFEGKWFEVSPHEAGFTELGLFVETSLLGSKFKGGELLEKKPEMDIIQFQGIFGSALANDETIKQKLYALGNINPAAEKYIHAYKVFNNFIWLIRGTIKDLTALTHLDQLQKILQDKLKCNHSVQLSSKHPDEKKSLLNQLNKDLLAAVQTWSRSLENGDFKTHVSFITEQLIPLIIKWEWGTTNNFLYQYQDSSVPAYLQSEEQFHLMDAGLLINVGYPSFLGDKRDIDLIIAPEYSAGNMFETLTLSRAYAAEARKPFPKIDDAMILEDRAWPKDCYVFEGKDKEPTIVYMPLFNRQNCKDAEEFKAKMEKFTTFQAPYSQEQTNLLLETAKTNIRNNRETLLREINKAVIRRKNRSLEQTCKTKQSTENSLQ